jgi:hypothetical protein
MSIKIELKEPVVTKPVNPLPSLYKSKSGKLVMLFVTDTTGVVMVSADDAPYLVGEFCNNFIPCFNTDTWERLSSGTQIILEQE